MRDQFYGVVINELRRFEAELSAAALTIRGKTALTVSERTGITETYARLKSELRAANQHGTVGGVKRKQAESEAKYFAPAVRQALIALRAPTNSNPMLSRWTSQMEEATREIAYHLYRLEADLKTDQ